MEKGEKIYHYTTIDTLISITSGKEFWVTKWDYLNDIDEFRVAEDVCEAVLREENVNEKTIKEIKQSIAEERLFELYLCSFSCDGDNQLLWSNYSDCDGVNLEIDCLKLVFMQAAIICITAFAAIVLPFACRVTLQSLCAATAFARMPAGRICSPCSLMTVTVLLTIINRSF